MTKSWAKLATAAMTAWCLCISIERCSRYSNYAQHAFETVLAQLVPTGIAQHCLNRPITRYRQSGCFFQHVHMLTISPDFSGIMLQVKPVDGRIRRCRTATFLARLQFIACSIFVREIIRTSQVFFLDLSSALLNMCVHKCELSQAHEAHVGNEIQRARGKVEDLPVSIKWSFVQSF